MDAGTFIGDVLKFGCGAVLAFGLLVGLACGLTAGCVGCQRSEPPREKTTIIRDVREIEKTVEKKVEQGHRR